MVDISTSTATQSKEQPQPSALSPTGFPLSHHTSTAHLDSDVLARWDKLVSDASHAAMNVENVQKSLVRRVKIALFYSYY